MRCSSDCAADDGGGEDEPPLSLTSSSAVAIRFARSDARDATNRAASSLSDLASSDSSR